MKIENSFIRLDNLRFFAHHGVLEQERLTGGDFRVSLCLQFDVTDAASSDDVRKTLNYAEIYEVVKQEILQPSALIENVAWRIGKAIFSRWPDIEKLTVSVTKNNPPMGADCDGATVELHLTNEKSAGKL